MMDEIKEETKMEVETLEPQQPRKVQTVYIKNLNEKVKPDGKERRRC